MAGPVLQVQSEKELDQRADHGFGKVKAFGSAIPGANPIAGRFPELFMLPIKTVLERPGWRMSETVHFNYTY
jgi:hypothetical protein